MYERLADNNIHHLEYRGKDLYGPSYKLFLDKKLEKLCRGLLKCLHDFLTALEAFDKVCHSCFSNDLNPYFENFSCKSKTSENKAIEITPNIHILLNHVPGNLCFCRKFVLLQEKD